MTKVNTGFSGEENAIQIPDLSIKDFNTTLSLEDYALSNEQLSRLRELWKGSPSADELCKMLRP